MKHPDKSLEDNKHASEIGRGTGSSKEPTTDALSAGESRRRFVKGSLAAAPVLMTVVSRPAWGNVCAPSGMVSGNLSTPGADTVDCATGLAPNDYVKYVPGEGEGGEWILSEYWPSSLIGNDDFDSASIFQTGPNIKLKQILANTADDTDPALGVWQYDEFYRAAVAALCNAVEGKTATSPYMVKCMVYDVLTTGYYMVAPDCPWSRDDVLYYFMFTWGEGPLTVPV